MSASRYTPLKLHDFIRSPVAFVLRIFIRIYGYTLSSYIGGQCRFMPTCSEYSDEALLRFGAWAGFWMTLERFIRCNPFGGCAQENVPIALPDGYCWYKPWMILTGFDRT